MEYKKIIELTTVVTGGTPSTEKREYWDNGSIPWLQSGCCQNCEVNSAGKYITQEGYDNSSTRMMPADTVMIALTGATAGKVGYLNFAACGNQSITGILPCGALNQRYLFYYLISQRHKILADCVGGAQAHISQGYVKNIKVPVLSLVEQEQVVEVLTQLNNIISMRRKEIGLLDTLVKSRFVELFGDPYVNPLKWKRLKIKDAVTIEPQNGLYKPQSDYVADGTGTPILRIDGFYNGRVTDFGSLKRLKCSGMEQQRYLLLEDDIVINRVNSIEYLGKCAHIKGLLEDTVYESNMMRMHFDPEHYNPVYICKLLCSQYIYDQIVNHAKKAVNQASINQKDVLDFNIYQPPLELQNQFADFVVSVDKSK
jgi:type I restriction enzyme S subunit